MRTIRSLAFLCAVFAYALIVLGAVVRITESGLGCGPNWPLCNGQIIPSFNDHHTVIEFTHRVAVLGLAVLVVALGGLATLRRGIPGVGGRGGPFRPAMLALGLLLIQIGLGAVTVWLDLRASAVVLHLGTAMALLATLLVAALRAGSAIASPAASSLKRGAIAGLAMAGVAILLGGLTATTGAASACQGFPLCNGQVWPGAEAGGLARLHWIHRLVAYALFFHLSGIAMASSRRVGPGPARTWAWTAAGCVVLQVIVAAAMVLSFLPPDLRGAHVAVGTAIWVALVCLVWHATRPPGPAQTHVVHSERMNSR
jgi:heme A synthase